MAERERPPSFERSSVKCEISLHYNAPTCFNWCMGSGRDFNNHLHEKIGFIFQ